MCGWADNIKHRDITGSIFSAREPAKKRRRNVFKKIRSCMSQQFFKEPHELVNDTKLQAKFKYFVMFKILEIRTVFSEFYIEIKTIKG